jgi:hypoxanthine phosphoribosyltransferase
MEHITTARLFNSPAEMCYSFFFPGRGRPRPPFKWSPSTMPELAPNVMISAEDVQARITDLAREICAAYPPDEDLHLVAILKGAFLFLGDLIRAMDRHVTIDFMAVSSYAKGTTSSGEVRMVKDLDSGLEGRNVIIVEDIVDTGLTLAYLQEILHARNPKTLRTACLLSKPSRRKIDVKVEYIGFTIEDRFVVGYGLDYAEKYRNLPFIGVLNE